MTAWSPKPLARAILADYGAAPFAGAVKRRLFFGPLPWGYVRTAGSYRRCPQCGAVELGPHLPSCGLKDVLVHGADYKAVLTQAGYLP